MKLVFATQNQNKVNELKCLMPEQIELKSLKEINCNEDIPETAPDLKGNALQKAKYVNQKYKVSCFADDTGLEIEALNNEPGVFSARYAGPNKSSNDNMNLVLQKLSNSTNRKARFKTVISLIIKDKTYFFEGICKGKITTKKSGTDGFGYDPIFIPEGFDKTFAEMSMEEKNKISHRGKAVKQLIDFLKVNFTE
ncbi:MAG TPA: non-canonical purine NTP diphosphatase [Crocinitomix sp.]|nr:non-canonical purine NTP diphosphatase [Crocinitomix sp.]